MQRAGLDGLRDLIQPAWEVISLGKLQSVDGHHPQRATSEAICGVESQWAFGLFCREVCDLMSEG